MRHSLVFTTGSRFLLLSPAAAFHHHHPHRLFAPSTNAGRVHSRLRVPNILYSTTSHTSDRNDANGNVVIPRAAVSVVARCECHNDSSSSISYALVQRGKETNKGIWSFPGGKIESGESTLDAAKRELWEETRLGESPVDGEDSIESSVDAVIRWHSEGPITSSDSIHIDEDGTVQWHYVISQYFASVEPATDGGNIRPIMMIASDDAADARFWTVESIKEGIENKIVTPGVLRVIERAEAMYDADLLDCTEG